MENKKKQNWYQKEKKKRRKGKKVNIVSSEGDFREARQDALKMPNTTRCVWISQSLA